MSLAAFQVGALALFGGLSGCTTQKDFAQEPSASLPAQTDATFRVRVDVIPAPARTDAGELVSLPRSTEVELDAAGGAITLPPLVLPTPIETAGTVVAYRVNPMADAQLPGATVPVAGLVTLRAVSERQTFAALAGDDGRFSAWVLPGVDYTLSIVPDDPALPTWFGPLDTAGELGTLDLGDGAPVYGFVTDGERPLAGVAVHAENGEGQATGAASTDADGFYQLRVQPGTWRVVSEGRPFGIDPTLVTAPREVGPDGLFASFVLRPGDERVLVEGTVRAPAGDLVPGTTIRFTSRSLAGYPAEPAAAYQGDAAVNSDGRYLVQLSPGIYDVEVLPPANDDGSSDHGPRRVEAVDATADVVVDVETTGLRDVRGRVRDEAGQPIAGARISCQEEGFDGHTFTAFSEEGGRFATRWPPVLLACEVAPPGERDELAPARVHLDGASSGERVFELRAGVELRGEVRSDADEPASGAVVEVRDPEDDHLLGFDVTDERGGWSVRLDPAAGE